MKVGGRGDVLRPPSLSFRYSLYLIFPPFRGGIRLTPALFHAIIEFPWRFVDSPIETADSFIHARVQAFASRADLPNADVRVAIGQSVVGFLEPSSGDAKSAQLVGWDLCPLLDWELRAANTLPDSPCELNSDVLYVLPQVSAATFSYCRFPNAGFTYLAASVVSAAYKPLPIPLRQLS